MTDKNLFLGGSTYTHTPAFPTELADQLRFCANAFDNEFWHNLFSLTITKSAERIEQLERELQEAQKFHARYEYMRKLTPHSFNVLWSKNLHGYTPFDDLVDAAISEAKK